jgi:hypothetical protein
MKQLLNYLAVCFFCLYCAHVAHAEQQANKSDLWFFVLVKSSNYSQDKDKQLSLLNYHFFSELFGKKPGAIQSASLQRLGDEKVYRYTDRGNTFYYEGGHFKSVDAVDQAHPNGEYRFNIELSSGEKIEKSLRLSGDQGETDIPQPITISLYQNELEQPTDAIDSGQDLAVRWSKYSNGRDDVNGVVNDMIFVVFQNCFGKRVFHTGLPFKNEDYLTHAAKEVIVPSGVLEAGQPYSMFVEFPHVVDSVMAGATPGFTSYATATYLDIETKGEGPNQCPEKIPPLDTGQTDRMDVEIK